VTQVETAMRFGTLVGHLRLNQPKHIVIPFRILLVSEALS